MAEKYKLEEVGEKGGGASLRSRGSCLVMKIITESIEYQKEMENTSETMPN